MLAIYLLLRGHNLPGGGFVAGITLAIAVILQYMGGSTRWVESRLAIRPARWMGTGLPSPAPPAPARGCSGTRFSPRTSCMPGCRSSARCTCRAHFFFDLGVFSLVVGATGLILIALAHQSLRPSWS